MDVVGAYMHASDVAANVHIISGPLHAWYQAAPADGFLFLEISTLCMMCPWIGVMAYPTNNHSGSNSSQQEQEEAAATAATTCVIS